MMWQHFSQRLALFKLQPFRWFIISCFLACVGSGIGYITLAWLVVSLRPGVFSVAVLMLCYWLPNALLGPLVGVLVDRVSRKTLVLISCAVRAVLWIVFGLLLIHHNNTHFIYGFTILISLFFTIYSPSATKLVREIIPKEKLLLANANIDMAYESGNLVGMGIAGFLIAWLGATQAVVLNGCFFVLTTIAILIMHYRPAPVEAAKTEVKQLVKELWEGLIYIYSNRDIRRAYTAQMLVMVTYLTAPVLMAPFAKVVLHATVGQFCQIEAACSIGLVVGGLFLPVLSERIGLAKTVMAFSFLAMLAFAMFEWVSAIWNAEVLYFIIGTYYAIWPLVVTRAQHITDFAYQGRTQASFNSLAGIVTILIYLTVALMGSAVSVVYLFWFEAALAILTALMLL